MVPISFKWGGQVMKRADPDSSHPVRLFYSCLYRISGTLPPPLYFPSAVMFEEEEGICLSDSSLRAHIL